MTILAKYYPYKLAGGVSWDDVKEDATDQIVDCIARVMQNLKDVYICGSGAHPGGGVSGAPGHNAARRVIADLKRK